ncbi:ABC transporter permease [Xanthobacter pseudotagetidis]|uniref:ABC transporter permease n=1 Tax=Xanthobacter pseudotagetidis TaxID=3119911 RepID=UPI003726DAF5
MDTAGERPSGRAPIDAAPSRPTQARRRLALGTPLLTLAGFALLIGAWHVASVYLVRSVLFPPPLPVFRRACEMLVEGDLLSEIAASLGRILVGFLLGSLVGAALGLLVGSSRLMRVLLDPMLETLRFIPAVAMITVAVIWFGIGEESKVFIIFYATVFIVLITTAAGVAGISKNKIRAAKTLGAGPVQTFAFVILPATVPMILTGMRVAMSNAFTAIVAAEMVSANNGIGSLIWKARLYMLIDDIFVALMVLAALGFLMDRLFRWAISTFAGRYSPQI